MYFERIYEEGLAQASYFIGCQATKQAIVIDPKRDIDTYLNIARERNFHITDVTETHIHADFLSGSRELAKVTGARLRLSDEGGTDWSYQFPHLGLKDGDIFMIGNIKFESLHTPGHTPEHISFLLTDTPASAQPSMIFTGDFVFVGDVGRPDLLEEAAGLIGTKRIGAQQMFQSLKKFKALPDFLQVWPGHGAGSACGKALGAVPVSTVGYEKSYNWALQYDTERQEDFINTLLEGQPEPPRYFAMMKKLNKVERSLLTHIPPVDEWNNTQLKNALEAGMTVVDTRSKMLFAYSHIAGTINIQNNNAFSNWAGWLLDYDKPFALICEREQIDTLSRKLIRVGLDNLSGIFCDMDGWIQEHPMQKLDHIEAEQLNAVHKEKNCTIVDVRGLAEYKENHIDGAVHIPLGYLSQRLNELEKDRHIVMHCAGGDRSSTACSLLQRAGFKRITNLAGGFNAWADAGLHQA